jgi:hypothetical protein
MRQIGVILWLMLQLARVWVISQAHSLAATWELAYARPHLAFLGFSVIARFAIPGLAGLLCNLLDWSSVKETRMTPNGTACQSGCLPES